MVDKTSFERECVALLAKAWDEDVSLPLELDTATLRRDELFTLAAVQRLEPHEMKLPEDDAWKDASLLASGSLFGSIISREVPVVAKVVVVS